MSDPSPTLQLLSRALDVSALRQSVYAANVANVNVTGYQRLEVQFDERLERAVAEMSQATASMDGALEVNAPQVVSTDAVVKLDEEMASMAKNALRYQTLLGVYERMAAMTRSAVHEGRE